MKKLILLLLFVLLVSCVDNNDVIGDCYVSPEPEKVCVEIYVPNRAFFIAVFFPLVH